MTSDVPQLTTTTVFEGNGSVLVRYDLNGPVPTTSTFLVGFHALSADGKVRKQFGVKFLDGQAIALFVFDNDETPQQANFDYVAATDDPKVILTPYPSTFWDALGKEPQLRGFLNYDGDDRQTAEAVQVVRQHDNGRSRTRPQDDYTQQMSEEEHESLGEGARRDLFDLGPRHDADHDPTAPPSIGRRG